MPAADLTFLYGESVPRCTHRIDKLFAGYSTLQYMSAGGVELTVGPKVFALEGRWFWSAYPGPRIKFHAARGHKVWRHRYIAFRGKLVDRWRESGLFPIVPQRPPHGEDYGDRFDAMLRLATRGEQFGKLRAVHLLEGMLIDLAEARSRSSAETPWLERSLEKLGRVVAGGEVDYAQLAAACDMSSRSLRRKFAEAMGVPPHEYVLNARITEARRLLGETDIPVKSIAKQLGYNDVYFFTRQFKQFAGVPPVAYRRSRQG